MLIDTFAKALRPFRPQTPEIAALEDADRLIAMWGDAAYVVATARSHREGLGFAFASGADHWSRVKSEIGHRCGWEEH